MNVVITGSTKGIGLGLAREFLQRGHNVAISSRGQGAVDTAVSQLQQAFPAAQIVGAPCDVANRVYRGCGGLAILVNRYAAVIVRIEFCVLEREAFCDRFASDGHEHHLRLDLFLAGHASDLGFSCLDVFELCASDDRNA